MPTIHSNGATLYYEASDGIDKRADHAGDPVVFLGEIGLGVWAWGWQHNALTGPFRTIAYDTRGCGRSSAPPGPVSIDDLVADFVEVLRAASVRRAHLVGCGLGAATALQAAADTNRVRSLTLIGAASNGDAYDLRHLRASPSDEASLRETTRSAVSATFAEDTPTAIDDIVNMRAAEDAPLSVWDDLVAALEAYEPGPLYEVTVPTLVVHGSEDAIVPIAAGQSLADALPRGEFFGVDGAGHFPQIERSQAVTDRLFGFLDLASDY